MTKAEPQNKKKTSRSSATGRAAAAPAREARAGRGQDPEAEARSHDRPDPVFRGPNYWSYEPRSGCSWTSGRWRPSNRIPGFNEGLLELLPGVAEHSCSLGRRGGFGERLVDGTWLGHVAATPWSSSARPARTSRAARRGAPETGRYNVIYGYWEESVGLEAGKLAVRG